MLYSKLYEYKATRSLSIPVHVVSSLLSGREPLVHQIIYFVSDQVYRFRVYLQSLELSFPQLLHPWLPSFYQMRASEIFRVRKGTHIFQTSDLFIHTSSVVMLVWRDSIICSSHLQRQMKEKDIFRTTDAELVVPIPCSHFD